MKFNIRLLYLYLFSFVGLLIVVIAGINMVNLGLKTYVFKEADYYEVYRVPKMVGEEDPYSLSPEEEQERQDKEVKRSRQREFSNAISMLAVGIPLYLYHWNTIKSDAVGTTTSKKKSKA